MRQLPAIGGYLTHSGDVNLGHVDIFLGVVRASERLQMVLALLSLTLLVLPASALENATLNCRLVSRRTSFCSVVLNRKCRTSEQKLSARRSPVVGFCRANALKAKTVLSST